MNGELINELFAAYLEARKNKRNTVNQLEFEMNFEHNLFELATDIRTRTYKVGKSVCFIVNNPVKREIFAADFRDRVVHHLIYRYINPILERKLIRDCYSCRKGFGTSDGVKRIMHHFRSVSNNYSSTAWVLKLDIQGYFMSVDRTLLFGKVERIVSSGGLDVELTDMLIFLLREVIFTDPTLGCVIKGNTHNWDGLPPSKSLFNSPKGCGLPIGNLTSQMFSNIYLSDFDDYVKRMLKMRHYGRYVDDMFFMHREKELLLAVRDSVSDYLQKNYRLTIHPKKIYLQPIEHGVIFLGVQVKPYRLYVRNSTLSQMRKYVMIIDRQLLRFDDRIPNTETLSRARSLFNSCFGYTSSFKTLKMRQKWWNRCEGFRKYFSISSDFKKLTIKQCFTSEEIFRQSL
jgi:hypothetical protein